jgi:predicted permease
MSDTPKWHRYLRFWRGNVTADVDAELAFHVDARTQELIDSGIEATAARAQALREFGDIEHARTTLRSMDERHAATERRANFAAGLSRDVRVAVRSLARAPGLVAVVTLTLALGIGLTSATYSVVDAFLFQPLAGVNTSELVVLGRTDSEVQRPHEVSFPDYRDYRADTSTFESLAAYTSRIVELNTDRGADRMWLDDATANYFSVLGLRAMIGRTFAPGDDDGVLAHPQLVLTYKGWQTRFAGDSSVVGRVVRVNDHPMTIVGVLPPEFHGVRAVLDIDAIAPLNQVWPTYGSRLEDRSASLVNVFGRLKPSVSLASAREAVRLQARRLEAAYPTTNKAVGAVLIRERYSRPSITVSELAPEVASLFMALVMLVLLVACANVASLMLARVVVRSRELAIRTAIGASQWRIVRQVLVECVLLAALGGAGAIAVATLALRGLNSIQIATDIPIRWGIELNLRVVLFTALATMLAALAIGIAPAAASRKRDLNDLLKSSVGNSGSAGQRRLRSALVVGQIAVSVVVLVCTGLFVRSSSNATRMSLGFRTDHLLMVSATLRPQSYDSVRGDAAYRELLRRAAAVPGVKSAALTRFVPFGYDRESAVVFPIASGVPVPANGFGYCVDVIAGDYFSTMGVSLLQGRAFTDRDDARSPAVAIVNSAFANAVWPGQPAIGKRFHLGGANGPVMEIVGVVSDMQDQVLGDPAQPYVFRPIGQSYQSDMTLVVQTAGDPSALGPTLRQVVRGLDPTLPTFDVRTMDEHIRNGQAMLFTRIASAFAAVFGMLALVLATVGVYGVVSYSVAQRTREIGVRVALGAQLPAILRLVLVQGLRLAWIGIGTGLVLAMVSTGVMSSVLYGVAPRDPVVLGGVAVILTIVAGVASLVPARRATKIDPRLSLRAE